jgi:hypothetical protein
MLHAAGSRLQPETCTLYLKLFLSRRKLVRNTNQSLIVGGVDKYGSDEIAWIPCAGYGFCKRDSKAFDFAALDGQIADRVLVSAVIGQSDPARANPCLARARNSQFCGRRRSGPARQRGTQNEFKSASLGA